MLLVAAIVAFLAMLTVLVLVHELGHFFVARWMGVKVEEFGIGFPPRAKAWKRGELLITLNWLPIGGFVRMLGQDDFNPTKESHDPRSYERASFWAKIAIALAGVVMNLLLAIALLWGGYMVGMEPILRGEDRLLVHNVTEASPAMQAGFKAEDVILQVNGVPVTQPDAFSAAIGEVPGEQRVRVLREGGETELLVTPAADGKIGVAIGLAALPVFVQAGPVTALGLALEDTWSATTLTVAGLKKLVVGIFTEFTLTEEVGGPVRIAQVTYEAVQVGWDTFLQLVALLSISLAVLNAVPFPALDGGHVLFAVIDRIKPVSVRVRTAILMTGMALLLALIAATVVKDVLRLFHP